MTHNSNDYPTLSAFHQAIAESFVTSEGTNSARQTATEFANNTNYQLADMAIFIWRLDSDDDFSRDDLIDALADLRRYYRKGDGTRNQGPVTAADEGWRAWL
jgi:hypothetical protein